ncbi:MAG: hypothetical protein ACXWRE_01095 [Pseudobdellovibrionaceae bacterium]
MLKTQFISERSNTLRLGYSFFGSIEEIDPNYIQTIYQSNIIENLFSRLIEYDNAGQIVCSLCSSFNIDHQTIRFYFKNPSKTIDGYIVAAIAAKASLDRILLSQTNTHGSLRYYLSANSDSPIQVENEQLLVRLANSEWVPFVLNLLTSMDFSIVPKESLDSKSKRIIDYRNTSGLFYVDFSDDKGNLRLRPNQNHTKYKSSMPGTIQFIPLTSGKANEAFVNDEIDMIEPTYYAYQEDIEHILKNFPAARLHKTLNIGLTSLIFTSRAMKSSSIEDRITASLAIRNIFLKKTPKIFGAEETDQFFQSFGQGFISREQKQVLRNRIEQSKDKSKNQFILGVTEKYRPWLSQIDFPNYVILKFYKLFPGFLPEKEKPDVYIMNGDSSFDEDIAALSYLFSQETFSLDKDDGAKWIQNYMNIPSKDDRIDLLRNLHYEMLYNVKVFPIISRPYIAISNSKWDFNFPKLYAGTPLWKVWVR